MKSNRSQFVVKQNFILFNRLNNEQITGDLVNEYEIDGKQFYVLKVGTRMLKLAKDAYTPKRNLLTR